MTLGSGIRAPTWRHVEGRATAKIRREKVPGSQTKISELDSEPPIGHQNIFRLQVPVVYRYRMAVANRIQDLEKCLLGHQIVSNVAASLSDTGEQVTFRAVLEDDVCAVVGIHDGH